MISSDGDLAINEAESGHPWKHSGITLGNWATEPESVNALDLIINAHSELWTVRREVPGKLIQPGASQENKSVRIDRIVIPNRLLIDKGFDHGAFGIECKKSGEKIGPPIAQAMDYARSIYTLDSGLQLWLGMVFVWPMADQHGPLASVLYHQRVGSACCHQRYELTLRLGETTILLISRNGEITVPKARRERKAGSR